MPEPFQKGNSAEYVVNYERIFNRKPREEGKDGESRKRSEVDKLQRHTDKRTPAPDRVD